MAQPILVSLAPGPQAQEVLDTATSLARCLGAPIGVVYALPWHPLEGAQRLETRVDEARSWIQEALKPVAEAGIELLDPMIEQESPSDLVVELGSKLDAQLIVTGGGGADSMRRWLVGSVAETIVRSASLPVLVARGPLGEAQRPVVCPVDLSPHAHEGFQVAVRMARGLKRPLVTVTVVPPDRGRHGKDHLSPGEARDQVTLLAQSVDLTGVEVEHRIMVATDAAATIVAASQDAALLVMGTRSFTDIASTGMGAFTERVLRTSPCSTMVLRVYDVEEVSDEEAIRRLGRIKALAEKHLADDEPSRALPLLELLVRRAGAHPSVHERLAQALSALGRGSEADCRRRLAALLREQLD